MTGNEVFNIAISLMGETSATSVSYVEQALNVINAVLTDTFEINNMLRESIGLEPLEERLFLTNLSDEIEGYENELLYNLIPYGVGARLVIDDGEANKLGFLEQNYVDRFNKYTKSIYENMEDVY